MQARYLIGTDWNRKSYVVGLGKKGFDRTVHRGASCPPAQDAEGNPVQCPPDTRGSNRPDVNEVTGGVLWLPEVRHAHSLPPSPLRISQMRFAMALQVRVVATMVYRLQPACQTRASLSSSFAQRRRCFNRLPFGMCTDGIHGGPHL